MIQGNGHGFLNIREVSRDKKNVCFTMTLVALLFSCVVAFPSSIKAEPVNVTMTDAEAIQIGEKFGIVVGEVDEEIRDYLGLERAEGVVVFEVIGGKPASLAGIKPRALIKEINSVDIRTLKEFGQALKAALPTDNFTVATYEPADPGNQGLSGGINFHFVRIEKS